MLRQRAVGTGLPAANALEFVGALLGFGGGAESAAVVRGAS